MEIVLNISIFVILITSMVYITRSMLIKSIRTIAVYLKWDNRLVGQVLGYATSTPELLSTVVAASVGMIATGIYNIVSSNIINLILVLIITLRFKRFKSLINKKYVFNYIIVLISIVAPLVLIYYNIAIDIIAVPIVTNIYLLYIIASYKTYYFEGDVEDIEIEEKDIKKQERKLKTIRLSKERKHNIRVSILVLFISIVLLYVCSNILGVILENLGNKLNVPELILGCILGLVTATPELMTFISSYKKHKLHSNAKNDKGCDEVINNLVTSNVSNIAIIHSIAVVVYYLFGK